VEGYGSAQLVARDAVSRQLYGYSGRDANAFGKAARDPTLPSAAPAWYGSYLGLPSKILRRHASEHAFDSCEKIMEACRIEPASAVLESK